MIGSDSHVDHHDVQGSRRPGRGQSLSLCVALGFGIVDWLGHLRGSYCPSSLPSPTEKSRPGGVSRDQCRLSVAIVRLVGVMAAHAAGGSFHTPRSSLPLSCTV